MMMFSWPERRSQRFCVCFDVSTREYGEFQIVNFEKIHFDNIFNMLLYSHASREFWLTFGWFWTRKVAARRGWWWPDTCKSVILAPLQS